MNTHFLTAYTIAFQISIIDWGAFNSLWNS